MSAPAAKTNLLGLTRAGMEAFVAGMGEKPFRARQLMKWMYRRAVGDFDGMTDLGKDFRRRLAEIAEISVPEVITSQASADGTRKWLLRFESGQAVEMVFIPEPGRGTLCISSQVGCAMDCGFCSTGAQGFNRNLTTAEIVGQVWLANRELGYSPDGDRVITNVVFMGMGEPLHHYEETARAIRLITHPDGLNMGPRRITVSTVGLSPGIRRLGEDFAGKVGLAISLHAPDEATRGRIIPINRRYPLGELIETLRRYPLPRRRRITIEYTLIDGVNDSPEQARALVRTLRGLRVKVNLIAMNAIGASQLRAPPPARVEQFRAVLTDSGLSCFLRTRRGDDVSAACGQLALSGDLVRRRGD